MTDEATMEAIERLRREGEERGERIREVEMTMVELRKIPEQLDKIGEQMSAVVRLDERVSVLERERKRDSRRIDAVEDDVEEELEQTDQRLDSLERKLAYYGGGIAALLGVLQVVLELA